MNGVCARQRRHARVIHLREDRYGIPYRSSHLSHSADAIGAVYRSFWRWLNSDCSPYMQNTVQVWSGSSWVTIWQTAGPPAVFDAAWTEQVFDVTAHASAAFRVRFGYQVSSGGVFTVSSWNVDDVTLAHCL